MIITKEIKLDLFNLIKEQTNPFGDEGSQDGLLPFLNQVWNLRTMPSQDGRPQFKDAYDDIYQHTVNNSDWTIDYLFIERLNLLEEDSIFIKFLEAVLSPANRKNQDEITKYVLSINPYLERVQHKLAIEDYNSDGIPLYKVKLKDEADSIPIDIKENSIPFFVTKAPSGRSDRQSSHVKPAKTPSFVLSFNDGWNDYSIKSTFTLFYYDEAGTCNQVGDTKIIYKQELDTSQFIDDEFFILNDDFCSLGQSDGYYFNLKNYLKVDFESILFALKDAAFFPDIHDQFDNNIHFNSSLIRNDSSERRLREIKYKLFDFDLTNLYKFKYTFKPVFSPDSIDINFEFDNNKDIPNRIYAIIGKNGTGKTQLITSLPIKISEKDDNSFIPRAPLFSKVIAVSYSSFDNFPIPRKTSSFNYVYCGLRNEKEELRSDRSLVLRFHNSWKKIQGLSRTDHWRQILLNFIDEDFLNEFILEKKDYFSIEKIYDVNVEGFNKVKNRLSSGQSSILYIITEIIANIRYDSLLLYDEPETHLHPNAISQLVNTIYDLVNKFESYCIIATHSPLIIGELFSKNVYVIEREGNTPSIRKIGIESFGENAATLTEEVFGNKEIPKQYKKIILELVASGKTYDDIVNLLEFDQVALGFNARLFIKSLTN